MRERVAAYGSDSMTFTTDDGGVIPATRAFRNSDFSSLEGKLSHISKKITSSKSLLLKSSSIGYWR